MSNENGVLPVAGTDNPCRKIDILFLHGLGGNSKSTWRHGETKFFWPEALAEDLPDAGVWTIGYDASPTRWQTDTLPLEDRTGNLINQLAVKDIGQKPFVLIVHSLGGLLAKLILTQADISNNESHKALSKNCIGVVFLAVPHQGSGWSNALQFFNFVVRSNSILSQLAKGSAFLRLLNQNFTQYCERNEMFCCAFIEGNEIRPKKKLHIPWTNIRIPLSSKGIKIVDADSASASFLSSQPVMLDEDHISIAKMASKDHLLFDNIIRLFLEDPGLLKKKQKSNSKFSEKWFVAHANESIQNLGHRYTPELNIELDISKKFDAFSRNSLFKEHVRTEFHLLKLSCNTLKNSFNKELAELEQVGNVESILTTIDFSFEHAISDELQYIDIQTLFDVCDELKGTLHDIGSHRENLDKENNNDSDYKVNEIYVAIRDFESFARNFLSVANSSAILLTGEAGIGKSHLLADITSRKIKNDQPVIFLLGQLFTNENPWSQIITNHIRLGFSNEDALLAELNEIAQDSNEKLLFIIDAINEGQGKYIWPQYISGFIQKFCDFPYLGLVLSVRSSYERLLTPESVSEKKHISRVEHSGFSNIEYAASSSFFKQYGINQPSTPLLHPEFSNPLFLKIFCEGIHRSGLTSIPKGSTGLSQIINRFVNSINKKLSSPSDYDYPEDQNVVNQALTEIISVKFENNRQQTKQNFISYDQALKVSNEVISKFSNKKLFLDSLISEGLLSKNLFWSRASEPVEGIYFAYERFEDHFTTVSFLKSYPSLEKLKEQFTDRDWLEDLLDSYINQGFIESLSIQLPELYDVELYELLSEERRSDAAIVRAFVKSLIWRRPQDFDEKTDAYIVEHVLPDEQYFQDFIHLVYSVAADPDHRYNADYLHKMLIPMSMADRDADWTVFLHDKNHEGSAIRRLIDWALSTDDKEGLSDESRLLACKALSWIFTSTNIPLRDYATEGLVALLENNLLIAYKLLLMEFNDVNDPYVLERIYAATYGAVLRSEMLEDLGLLSAIIFSSIFLDEEVYPNALVRDYARNIIEYAIYKKLLSAEHLDDITPPYRSSFPESFPTDQEIDAYEYDYNSADFKDHYWGINSIISSMGTEHSRNAYGDFGRYTFQSKLYSWKRFNPNDLSNYACKLIFEEYGYDVEKHGKFDRHAGSSRNGRYDNLTERIGKKYQWIALYEVIARLSDNYQMDDPSSGWGNEEKEYMWYQGTWDPFIRNIDPSVKACKPIITKSANYKKWWHAFEYDDLDVEHLEWLSSAKDLPCEPKGISVTDPSGERWLVLDTHQEWEEAVPLGVKKYDHTHKNIWMMLKSVLVKKEDYKNLSDWLNDKHFMGRWFPEGRESLYQVFSREYYWSPAYRFYLDNYYYSGEQWKEVTEQYPKTETICDVLPTSEGHAWETGSNQDDTPNYLAPVNHIFQGMRLQYSQEIGVWLDENNDITCFDPSIKHGGSRCLLVREKPFVAFLKENELEVIWTCLGQKMVIDGFSSRYPAGLEFSGVFTLTEEGVIEGGITKSVSYTNES